MNKTIRVIISGRVQGVGFRAWTVATASHHQLKGWVRNRMDGTVEAVFSGHEETVSHMLRACQSGPPAASVDTIEHFTWNDEVEEPFSAKPTV